MLRWLPQPWVGAAVLAVLFPDAALTAVLQIEDRTACFDVAAMTAALGEVLEEHRSDARGLVAVTGSPAEDGVLATLRVVTALGETVLERQFRLRPEDCASAADLTATVLERFLKAFPHEQWGEEHAAPPSTVETMAPAPCGLDAQVLVGAGSRWFPLGGDLEVGVAVDAPAAESHHLSGSLVLRTSLPHRLEDGRYFESLALLGLGWRYDTAGWQARVELRSGALLVSGFDYNTNYHRVLFALELHTRWMYRLGGVWLGPELGVSPLGYRAHTAGGGEAPLSPLRLGVVLALPLGPEKR